MRLKELVQSLSPVMKREGLLDFNEAVQHPGKKLTFKVQTSMDQEEDLDLLEPVTGTVVAVSTGNVLLVEAHFKTKGVLECARCGAPIETEFEFEMNDDFMVEGVPSAYSHDSYAKVVMDEPEPIFHENAMILDRYVRQGLLLNMPQQPLCSGSWDGPCQNEVKLTGGSGETGHPAFQSLETLLHGDEN